MSTIVFGSFTCHLDAAIHQDNADRVAKAWARPENRQISNVHLLCRRTAKSLINTYESATASAWKGLEEKLQPMFAKREFSKTITKRKGLRCFKASSEQVIERKLKQQYKEERERFQWINGPENVVTHIEPVTEEAPTWVPFPDVPKRPLSKTPSMKRHIIFDKVRMSETTLQLFMRKVANNAKANGQKVEIIGTKHVVGNYIRKSQLTYFRTHVRHLDGLKPRYDITLDEATKKIVQIFANTSGFKHVHGKGGITPGMSGFVINPRNISDPMQIHDTDLFIVRGKHNSILVDARCPVSKEHSNELVHYSDPGKKFWVGFTNSFAQCKLRETDHQCTSDLDVQECGYVAALVCQAIIPCGKITCLQCAEKYAYMSQQEIRDRFSTVIEQHEKTVMDSYPQFSHVLAFLKRYRELMRVENQNYEAFKDITHMIGERKEAPFSHINKINELIIKGGMMTVQDYSEASDRLRELARYQKNRTENIQSGSIKAFRNKISAKAHVNMQLMCDNQLDTNGNFVWGQREYHAKRFFRNYFNVIDTSEGYRRHIVRENPRGTRKLAIGNLVMSTNLAALRKQLLGEECTRFEVSKECTSKRGANFVYQCCCVTHEDGTPLESEIISPTKNHLVIGNSGDSKYVDLPKTEGGGMYIAKAGYCYINIFLAMLVNVNEGEAKSFTKTVRDTLVPKLGTWPSMMDLATACHFLAVLYPETRNAELPRILVDHESKIFHVVDSYGSLSTGMHILKANTVNQLISFASDTLDSSMKMYLVGGLEVDRCDEFKNVKLLIRSIYRPELMQQVLTEEPYLLIMSVLSPGVLMALFNSGSLEKATQYWITRSHSLAAIVSMLSALAAKVSLAQTLNAQMNVIDEHASVLHDSVFNGTKPYASYIMAIKTLERMKARTESDHTLHDLGFSVLRNATPHLVEKSYLQELEQAWKELSWSERFSAMLESQRWRRHIPRPFVPAASADLGGRYDISLRSLLGSQYKRLKGGIRRRKDSVVCYAHQSMGKLFCKAVGLSTNFLPKAFKMIDMLIVISLLLTIGATCKSMINEHQQLKQMAVDRENNKRFKRLQLLYTRVTDKLGYMPTAEEFLEYVQGENPELVKYAEDLIGEGQVVVHQSKRESQANLERVVAFVALVKMLFDSERSDGVYKILTKLKGIMGSIDQTVHHQSLDDIEDILDEKKLTVDFVLQSNEVAPTVPFDSTFEKWWTNQLETGNVIPHYRTEGHFMEFTRENAAHVANEVMHGPHMDILIRGAVGSGKSTGLPFHLSKKGHVLLLEPTRPLAENVCKQLRGQPFNVNPTLRMRGLSTFGSTPITVMTSGYALHFLANNPAYLDNYKCIIFDECHVHDASAMAVRCLLSEYSYPGKILKVSATPPGHEVDFKTQKEVKVIIEESLSFQQFVSNLGSGCNSDILKYGANILVYVASYNEVDTLGKLLTDRNFKVSKVDGRTMKVGSVEIPTSGTQAKPHFVVATNIIENGVTLDIDVVVDFGLKVVPVLDVDNRLVRYKKTSISYGERIQRLGRVGRNKPGAALRIGFTEKGLTQIPPMIATEAAFLCFTYGLPVMTNGVSTSLLAMCTVKQARTMQQFELSPFYTVAMVRFDGTMHQEIFRLLKSYRLRDSEVILNKLAIPNGNVGGWMSVRDYKRQGCNLDLDDNVRIPFYVKDLPELLHEQIWQAVENYKSDAGFGRICSSSACKIAYTLQTDIHSIPRTVKIIDVLLEQERTKQAHFRAMTSQSCSSSNFSLSSITSAIRSKYAKDHTEENIGVLQMAKAQLLEFQNLNIDPSYPELVRNFGALECVHHQTKEGVSNTLKLKGHWNKQLVTRDATLMLGVLGGGAWMIYSYLKDSFKEEVAHQGFNRRQRQKLKFRQARDNRMAREVYGDDSTMEEYFGSAYSKKGKSKGRTRGMGTKTRKFVNMYGYDPTDYNFVRFVDPLTGHTLDENPLMDIGLVQEHFSIIRNEQIGDDKITPQHIMANPGLVAYYVKDATQKALKIDLTPHNPLRVCDKTATIAGFPEREFELRQTGQPTFVEPSVVPKANEVESEEVDHESKSLFRGLRDYNPIASSICQLTNSSGARNSEMFGLGFGGVIITNQHLFKRNDGELTIRSHHGEFVVRDTKTPKLLPCKGRDIVIIRLPKDFPPFPKRLQFRTPTTEDRVCLIGSNFQTRSISSTMSETSATYPVDNSHFWKHWISTKDGHCGLPIVSTRDGNILGLHSLANSTNTQNFYAAFPENFEVDYYLSNNDAANWIKQWRYNPDEVCWGSLQLKRDVPQSPFKICKLLTDLEGDTVYTQSKTTHWLRDKLEGNLKAVGACPGQLVTKHVVKGKCTLFETYLLTHPDERAFFQPLMGAYQKSALNKDAYVKDLMKYSKPIVVGTVDCEQFERAVNAVISMLISKGFEECCYVTDPDDIFAALNMKAAVGALYSGKKRDYFENVSEDEKYEFVRASCKRLFMGQKGVWNGSLKAELRPKEKVEANKTRSFTAAPIDTLLGGKVCVDDFNNQFYSLNLHCPWSVGMTKFRGGWDKLLRSLPDGWIYCDADGSQFDSSLSPYLINAVLNIRLAFMEKWDIGEQMLSNLYTEIVYTPIATPDGTIVKKFKGNNSGQPSTVVDNTLMVILAMTYSLLKLGYHPDTHDCICKYFVNGDDLVIAVHPSHEHIYDELQELFSQLGLNYTFTAKTENKEELWFMSHKGVLHDGMYIPKLEPERIVSILEWDRSHEPIHRLEAICASMVEAWGYGDLLREIRKFYSWVLEQAPYNALSKDGKAPYIAETALKKLYTDEEASETEIEKYLEAFYNNAGDELDSNIVVHQAKEGDDDDVTLVDAGKSTVTTAASTPAVTSSQFPPPPFPNLQSTAPMFDPIFTPATTQPNVRPIAPVVTSPFSYGVIGNQNVTPSSSNTLVNTRKDRDVDAGTIGTFSVPRLKSMTSKLSLPKVRGKAIMNLSHLAHYNPAQTDLSNTRAPQSCFQTWYEGVKRDYDVSDDEMSIILNGLMVWCIENGTSPNINGMWVMMDGETQVEYPIKPLLDHAKPTFRQIMAHFSNVAEAYIEKRNYEKAYMPRYGIQRNLTDYSLARYAFDFYEMTSTTPVRAREAHIQMKAAALRNVQNRLFGLDGNVGTQEEDTERHTAGDVNRNMHNLLGVRGV
uniref:Genome polyprotein n=2 Tax=Plum pox virus TaxID=12211 RepID=A0A385EJ53_9POTV|nr:polyprotein [Plum pox virus]